MNKLNLGAGEFKKEGFINVDWVVQANPDVVHDLQVFPYPFDDDFFDYVEADHVLEHVSDPFAVMRELHRLCKNGAEIVVRVPHFSRGFTHPEHKRGFDVTFPLYFDSGFCGGFQGVEYSPISMKLSWFAQLYLKKQSMPLWMYGIGRVLGYVFDFFAWLSPYACSRVWCYWVGGFEQIEYRFKVIK